MAITIIRTLKKGEMQYHAITLSSGTGHKIFLQAYKTYPNCSNLYVAGCQVHSEQDAINAIKAIAESNPDHWGFEFEKTTIKELAKLTQFLK